MIAQQDALSWAQQTFAAADLGDTRRTQRLIELAGRLARHAGSSLLTACEGDLAAKEGAYRFMRNDQIRPQDIRQAGFAATAQLAQTLADQGQDLVIPADTTTLAYTHQAAEALGDLGGPARTRARGWLVHSSLLLSQGGQVLGLLDQDWWTRSTTQRGQRHQRKERPYEGKESFKWQAAHQRVVQRLGQQAAARAILVCDREADVYELLDYLSQGERRFVVRIEQDRALSDRDRRLFERLERQAPLGGCYVQVPQRQGRKARRAKVVLGSVRVRLRPPQRQGPTRLRELELWAVVAQEVDAPAGVEPLCWRLWTSEAAGTLEEVRRVMGLYALRWRVEDFHKSWKSGAKAEAQRFATAASLERMVSVLAFVAVRLLALRDAAEQAPEASCTRLLEPERWRCLWLSVEGGKALPERTPSMRWAYEALGRLGGWNDSQGSGRVGWLTLWKGWQRLEERLEGMRLAQRLNSG